MRALMIDAAGRVRLGDAPSPSLGQEDVLLRVRMIGFCGSDLNTFRGLNPLVAYPRIPGHEIAATVETIGEHVPDGLFAVGDDVTVLPYTACGRCAACRRGRSNACRDNETLGVQRDGAMTELLSVPWNKVVSAQGLSRRELALVEPLSVGFHAVDRGRVLPSDTVVVIGCGAVGLGAIAGARERGANVIAVDVDEGKLEIARRAGASITLSTAPALLSERVAALTNGDGADVVIEAVGIPETFVASVQAAAFTGRVVYIGYAKAPVSYDTSQFVKKELDILGSRNATREDFQRVTTLLQRRTFPVDAAVSRCVSLDDAGRALEDWDRDTRSITRIHVELS
ncbi:MAG: zinc-binding alcohol dehydrogenase family protein [Gemmatimonadota bacterium]